MTFRSLRTKTTLALLLAALVPSLAFTVAWYRSTVDGQTRTVNGSLAAAASRGATAIEGVANALIHAVRVQSQIPTFVHSVTSNDPRSRGAAQRYLMTLRSADPRHILGYALIGTDGRVLFRTDSGDVFGDLVDDPSLSVVAASRMPVVTPVRIARQDSTEGRFRIAAAVRDENDRTVAILVAEITSLIFEDILREQVRLVGPGSQGIVYDRHRVRMVGTIQRSELFVSSNPMDDTLRDRLIAERRIRASSSGRSTLRRNVRSLTPLPDSTYTYLVDQVRRDSTWETWMAASAPVRPFSGRVAIELPEQLALGDTRRGLLREAIALLLLISLAIVLVAVLAGRQLTRPLVELASAVRRFSVGEHSARAPVRSEDETGQLAEAFNELGDRVDNLVTGLNERTRQLESDIIERERLEYELVQTRKMEAVGKLAGGVAHDFNNLLTVILQNVELNRDTPNLPDDVREAMEDMGDAAVRGADLTRQLLEFARRGESQPRVIDACAVIRGSERLLRNVLTSQSELTLQLPDEQCGILVDSSQFEQILVNLVANARDAMPTGGRLTISMHRDAPDATFPTGSVVLSVVDTGVGMSPEVRARVFEPFFTTKEATRGTGLGLATVYGIVTQCAGTLGLESTPGEGTQFTLRFPAALGSAEPVQQASAQSDGRGEARTILLVEDEMGVRHTVARSLRRRGHTVHEASDGREGIALGRLHGDRIDLLLSDAVMPGADGFVVAITLTSELPRLRVLLMSGYSSEARALLRSDAPDFPLIEKPFSLAALTARVEELLNAPT